MKCPYHFIFVLLGLINFLSLTSCVDKSAYDTPHPTLEYVQELIREGDIQFKNGNYQGAIDLYYQAEKPLDSYITYESKSQEKDTILLQRYQNLSDILKTRIWVTINAIDAKNLPPPK